MSEETRRLAMLTVKLRTARLEEFRIASMLRGTTMSALVSQFVAQVVREEMVAVPQAFRRRQDGGGSSGLIDLMHPNGDNNNNN